MSVDVSVVCPFFNESQILEQAIRALLKSLSELDREWELIVVDDGSTDGSGEIAARVAKDHPALRVLGYPQNRGRGHALRTGIAAARGAVVVTTEIDLSWGERIVHDLVAAMDADPGADMVVASPNLPGGGYRNVPWKRVFLSRLGNRIIRMGVSRAATMNTGMTRAYRRAAIQSLPLFEDGKEFHLEVILKAGAFGFRIREIPAWLEWKEYKHSGQRVARKSSSKVNRLIVSHSVFSLFANPVRYVLPLALATAGLGVVAIGLAAVFMVVGITAAYTALVGFSLIILAMILFVLGVVARQGNMIQHELWTLQRMQLDRPAEPARAQRSPDRPEERGPA